MRYIFAPDQIRKMANTKGFMISRANFYHSIRNPVYRGKIVVKAYKDEDELWVDGVHEALISEGLFQHVQDILQGRRLILRLQGVKLHECLPLKGLLKCAMCERNLTGSAFKGRNGLYYYYHAQNSYGCGCRYKADLLNEEMEDFIEDFVPKKGMGELYHEVAMDVYKKI
jgi:site-specific DNA recombinase